MSDTLDKIRATLSAVRRRSTSRQASDALDPDVDQQRPPRHRRRHRGEMQRAAAPEGERHHGVHDPAERDARAMESMERSAHARAPVNAVLDPLSNPRDIEWFVTGPDRDAPLVEDLVMGSPDGGMESFVQSGADAGTDDPLSVDSDDLLGGDR
ncbi:hypothetical protein [Halobaculum sp. D14]|uniref:hypothetical protein n=1 Tax=Halobaculum sp. D14 TaxID=3421642 RepID=UPI003EBB6A0C